MCPRPCGWYTLSSWEAWTRRDEPKWSKLMKYFHCKYHRGQYRDGHWVFGAVERQTGRCLLQEAGDPAGAGGPVDPAAVTSCLIGGPLTPRLIRCCKTISTVLWYTKTTLYTYIYIIMRCLVGTRRGGGRFAYCFDWSLLR